MFDKFINQAKGEVDRVLEEKGISKEIVFEEPIEEFGDLSTPICFELAPLMKKSPKVLAEELAGDMEAGGFIREIKPVNGYVNFYLNYEKLTPLLLEKIKSEKDNYGRGKGKEKIILECTSANPDGPLHIGHARNGIIGDTLARVMRFAGYDVETQYYVNDMGKQLAVVVWGLRRFKIDSKKKKDHAISEIYVKATKVLNENPEYESEISGLMKDYEQGTKEVKSEFEYAANYCLDGIRETLERIKINIDTYIWESSFLRDSSVSKALERLGKTKYLKKNDVLYLDLSEFGVEKELILTRKDGTSLYVTRDIAYHLWKSSRGLVVDIFGADHKLVSTQLSLALRILGVKQPEFVIYEFISLPGGKMSTRRGIFISLDELLDESAERALREVNKRRPKLNESLKAKIAESVGVGAVRFNVIKISPEKPIIFRWEEALDFERQGSPFIQYAHARACRILEKAEIKDSYEVPSLSSNEKKLVKVLSKFPVKVSEAAESRRPHIIANYALELADSFHRFYMFEPVLKSDKKDFRVHLVLASKIVLANTLSLLGIDPLEEM